MRYIRTEDDIFELKKPYYIDKINHLCWEVSFLPLVIHDMGEIIKQADTIEELCDEFVLMEEDNYPTLLECFDLKKKTFLRRNEYEFSSILPEKPIIYGAIWTDKGLIYVAKMNGKGELELL